MNTDDQIKEIEISSDVMTQVVKELGINSLPQEKQEELIMKMSEVLLKRLYLETMDSLGEQGREEYFQMKEGEVSPEQLEAFFKERIKNYDEMVQNVIQEFKADMLKASSEE